VYPSLFIERGAYEPSSAERMAPFHQDRTQRIAALSVRGSCYLVFPVEALLRLAKGREGYEVGWDEWKMHVVVPSIPESDLILFCISGCRLFCVILTGSSDAEVELYDFSLRGRAKYLSEQANADLGGVRCLASTEATAWFPWDVDDLSDMKGGHDGIAFFCVSVPLFSCAMKLSDVVQIPNVYAADASGEEEGVLCMWSF